MFERTAWAAAVLFASLILVGSGCGGAGAPVGSVSGKVTYRGEPVTEGTVSFTSDILAASGTGEVQPDGTYTLATQGDGLPLGKYQVCIMPPMQEESLHPQLSAAPVAKDMPNIPQKYRSFRTSGFEATVQEGENAHDFDMQ